MLRILNKQINLHINNRFQTDSPHFSVQFINHIPRIQKMNANDAHTAGPFAAAQDTPAQDTAPAPTTDQPPVVGPENGVHAQIQANQYGHNTPTKRSSSSGVWNEIKRLRGTLNNPSGDATHVCMVELKSGAEDGAPPKFCNALLKPHKTKATPQSGTQTWLTTRGAEHLALEHPVDSPVGAKFAARARVREVDLMEQQMNFGMHALVISDISTNTRINPTIA